MDTNIDINLSKWPEFANDIAQTRLEPGVDPMVDPTRTYIAVLAGNGYQNTALITSVLRKLFVEHGDKLVVVNQGRFQPDRTVLQICAQLGIKKRELRPAFLERRNGGIQMTREAINREYRQLTEKWAAHCDELHVFGVQQGPQLQWIRSFQQAGKVVLEWQNPERGGELFAVRTEEVPAYN